MGEGKLEDLTAVADTVIAPPPLRLLGPLVRPDPGTPQAQAHIETVRSAEGADEGVTDTVDLGRMLVLGRGASKGADPRFTIRGLLGEGAFGRVFLAHDRDIDREVAVKVFKLAPGETTEDVAREVQIAGRIEHPGVPPVYDVGVGDDGQVYCVMKRLEAEDLSDILRRLKAGDPDTHAKYSFYRRAQWVVQLLRILKAAHAKGILHRDVKPANLLVDACGELMLIDWGIAIDLRETDGSGYLCGTPWYMAPEQVCRGALDERTDLFAVGAVLYELLALELACPRADTVEALLAAIPTHTPPAVDGIAHPAQGCAPSEYYAVVRRALERAPEDRFASAEEMLEALVHTQEGVFEIICPRTSIKSRLHRLMRWLDREPTRNVLLLRASIWGGAAALIGCGLLAGLLLAGN